MTHQPKGGQCTACRHALEDCSHLPFNQMPPMSKHKGVVIVRCTEYARKTGEQDGRYSRFTAELAAR